MSTPMSTPDHVRASDRERERVVDALRQHLVDGRLTMDEFSQRLDQAFAARYVPELQAVLHDLPPAAKVQPAPARPTPRALPVIPAPVRTYLAVMALLVGIWLFTGAGFFWPIWPLLGWGMALRGGGCGARRSRASRCSTQHGLALQAKQRRVAT